MSTNFHRTHNPGPLTQTANQASPSLAKPEDFEVYCDNYSDNPESVSGQAEDDPEAAKRSEPNRGSNYQDAPQKP